MSLRIGIFLATAAAPPAWSWCPWLKKQHIQTANPQVTQIGQNDTAARIIVTTQTTGINQQRLTLRCYDQCRIPLSTSIKCTVRGCGLNLS